VIEAVHLHHVRGLEQTSLSLGPSVNLWVGDNGAGKTSILEAVSILSVGRSFVTSRLKTVISFGEPSLTVFANVVKSPGERHKMAVQISRNDDKKLRLDGESVRGQASLSRHLPVLQITPHSADLISGSPGDRRRFLDWGAFHWSGGVASVFSSFRRAMLQRNTLLRNGIIDQKMLDPWDLQVVTTGSQIDAWRREFLQDIEPRFVRLCSELGLGIDLSLGFKNGWGDEDLEVVLKKTRVRDIKARTSTQGPQRADFEVLRVTHRAVDTLSRGQLKIANLALVLAQLQAAGSRGIEPILCLDDIGAELDTSFLERMWSQILRANAQVLATGITTDRIGLSDAAVEKANVFHVKRGMIE